MRIVCGSNPALCSRYIHRVLCPKARTAAEQTVCTNRGSNAFLLLHLTPRFLILFNRLTSVLTLCDESARLRRCRCSILAAVVLIFIRRIQITPAFTVGAFVSSTLSLTGTISCCSCFKASSLSFRSRFGRYVVVGTSLPYCLPSC